VNPRLIGWICEWLGGIAVREPVTLREKVQEATKKGYEDQLRVGRSGVKLDRMRVAR